MKNQFWPYIPLLVTFIGFIDPSLAQERLAQEYLGTIYGTVIYPSEVLLAQKVCAVNLQSKQETCTETRQGQRSFSLQVTPGTYHVFSKACRQSYRDNEFCKHEYRDQRAYYNQYVQCGLTYACQQKIRNKSPIPVLVKLGETVKGIKPHDWYTR
jgi:hypothetical protein